MRSLNYVIGGKYRYPGTMHIFVLSKVDDWIFRFECGHWCTDNVFVDLINVSNGLQVSEDIQLKLFA